MTHEKIIKRDDGLQIKIVIQPSVSWNSSDISYDVSVFYREKGKRNWISIYGSDSWAYRRLKHGEERDKWIAEQQLKYVTPEEIHTAKLEAWEKLKPKM